MLTLYTYYRSSAAYRVRIALNLKGLAYASVPVHLARGEQFAADYVARNAAAAVPYLEDGDAGIGQSLAIIEYLEETHPLPPLLPTDALGRARVRGLALTVACEIHPLNNLRVLKHLKKAFGVSDEQKNSWYRHWVAEGFQILETRLAREAETGTFCHGTAPTLADCCLVPQVYNAQRFDVDLEPYPTIRRIHAACEALPAFAAAHPARQPDAEP